MNHLLSSHHDHIQPGLQPWGAASLFGMALCYVTLFVIYGAVLPAPTANDMASKIHRLVEHQTLVQWTYIVGYILFACLLSIAVQTLHRRYGNTSLLINTTSLFGLFWVVVLLCTGMIGITVLELLSNQYLDDQANSQIVYVALVLLESALGGGIEFIGGMWVLLLGIAGWRYRLFGMAFVLLSIVKGGIGIMTLFAGDAILRDLFGLSGIVWFVWLGVICLKDDRLSSAHSA